MSARKAAARLGLPDGYTLAPDRQGHYRVLRPDGMPLRAPSGLPLHVSHSPSDWRTKANELARIRRAISAGGGF